MGSPRLLAVALLICACGRPKGDDTTQVYDHLEIEPPTATLAVALGGHTSQDYTVYGVIGTDRTEITASCGLAIDAAFGLFAGPTVTVGPHGGKTLVSATCGDLSGTADLIVTLSGQVVTPGAPGNAPDLFNAATAATDPAHVPTIQYPLDKAVSPRNIPPIEVQWTAAANDLFHVTLASDFLTIDVYTTSLEAMLGTGDWEAIAGTAAGGNLSFVVEGLVQAAPSLKYASGQTAITMTTDNIDKTAIYWWASSQGSIMSQTFGATTAPNLVKADCTACHSVSRNGTRIGYSRCVAGSCNTEWVGFLRYNGATQTWTEVVDANNKQINGSFSTFAPIGNPFPDDSRALAMLTMAGGTLALYDPDTGTPVTSNLAVANHGPGMPRAALMPDWSPDGKKVVFTSSSHAGQWIDLDDGRIATMSYSYTAGAHVFGEPNFLVPDPITLPGGVYKNFFFPSFSPDGALIVFNAARASWRNFVDAKTAGQRLMLADGNGAWIRDLTALNGGDGDADITWPHWAPNISSDYYWVVFSSERDYGHRATVATSPPVCKQNGVKQCKQIWIGAISKNKLTGQIDPSVPPMWVPGQDPAADNISPYWSVPPVIQ